jgi:hypothetical protein
MHYNSLPSLINKVPSEKTFSSEGEEKLWVSLGLEKSDVKLLLESTTFITEQVSAHSFVLSFA